jgi:hypothetical protein
VANDDLDFEHEAALLRETYERGDKSALLNTIMLSILFRQPLPEWAAKAFEDAYNRVTMGGARSWDDVFGKPHLGKHKLSAALKNLKYGVHRRVRELHEGGERRGLDALRRAAPQESQKTPSGLPIDEALFEHVGRELGQKLNPDGKPISKTVISDLYYRVEHVLRRLEARTSEK